MLDGALLVGQEKNDVHPLDRDAVIGGGRLGEPGFERGKGEGRGAQEIATPHVHDDPFPGRRVVSLFNDSVLRSKQVRWPDKAQRMAMVIEAPRGVVTCSFTRA